MQKKTSKDWPELVISLGDPNYTQMIRRATKDGALKKIAPKIYTTNFEEIPENIIKRHRYQILGKLFPKAVISHSSAFNGGISAEGLVILTYKYSKNIQLPGLNIKLIKGPGPDSEDTPFLENLYISSRGRAFLENISAGRARGGIIKSVPQGVIEERLDRMARVYGSEELNHLRDHARSVSKRLGMEKEFCILDKLIGLFLGTQNDANAITEVGRSRALGMPFDPKRVELFAVLFAYLQTHDLPLYKQKANSPQAKINQAFFEAYFSNYIEGTVFEIKEAEQIIFENKILLRRVEDSHDILSTYQIISNKKWMLQVPRDTSELIAILKHRHGILMEARKDKMPGEFKDIANRAGNTIFVHPNEVQGTLTKGFEFYKNLPNGIYKAIFMMFLISEVHPFLDGNGRIARILMNAELDVVGQSRVIIPPVFRDDYLLALRKLSRKSDPVPYVKMLSLAQEFTASINYDEYHQTLVEFQQSNAFLEPTEGRLRFH